MCSSDLLARALGHVVPIGRIDHVIEARATRSAAVDGRLVAVFSPVETRRGGSRCASGSRAGFSAGVDAVSAAARAGVDSVAAGPRGAGVLSCAALPAASRRRRAALPAAATAAAHASGLPTCILCAGRSAARVGPAPSAALARALLVPARSAVAAVRNFR